MASHPDLFGSASPAGAPSSRAATAHWLHALSKMLRYAIVFTIISLTMLIVGFGSLLGSLFGHDD